MMAASSVRAWPGDPSGRTGLLRSALPSPTAMAQAVAAGYTTMRSGALGEGEARDFLAAGWSVAGRLHVLRHDLATPPPRPALRVRRAWQHHLENLAALDSAVFPAEWQLGVAGLTEALRSTPASRLRQVRLDEGPAGFAISGVSGGRGYLQRLAVAESAQRRGVGRALTVDALAWMRRRGAVEALVNTYEGNAAALALYRSLGFRDVEPGLVVLSIAL